ncbi:MAG: LysE family translocator [Albidovulum sp.]
MTVNLVSFVLYGGAVAILWATPGPVWLALTARALSGGYSSAWPLAIGVTVGDLLWPLLAIFGLAVIVDHLAALMTALRWIACGVFLAMGWYLIRHAGRTVAADARLSRPGRWQGFIAGVSAVLGNPKSILFYIGIMPGFFDLRHLTGADIAAIATLSTTIPLLGNLALAAAVSRARNLLRSPAALRRINLVAGSLLIAVGMLVALIGP